MFIALFRWRHAGLQRDRRAGRHFASTAGFVLGLVVLAFGAHAEDTLTLEEALRLAAQRSRQLAAQDSAATAAREMARAAAELPDPTLKAGISNLPVNGEDRFSLTKDFMTMRSVGVMQEFTRADKRRARSARFEREAETAQAGRDLGLANLRRDTALAWFDRYYQQRMNDLLAMQRDEARLQIDAADAAYRGGRGSQTDVFAARSAVAQLDDRIAQGQRQITTAQTQLARWIGEAAGRPLAAAPAGMQTLPFDLATIETQLIHHPQIAVMLREEEMARADADIARANKRADWSAELMYSQRGSAYSNMVSVTVSIPLQWEQRNRQDRELAAKLAVADQMRAQREEATREQLADVRMLLQERQSNLERLTRYDDSLIPLAAQRTQAAIASYRGGTGSLGAVLEARRNEIDTRMERLRLEMDTGRLWAELNYLIPAGQEVATPNP